MEHYSDWTLNQPGPESYFHDVLVERRNKHWSNKQNKRWRESQQFLDFNVLSTALGNKQNKSRKEKRKKNKKNNNNTKNNTANNKL